VHCPRHTHARRAYGRLTTGDFVRVRAD
jgi:hypothetical protein